MSYLVLARKWRPQNFEDLIGQEHVARTLQNAIRSDRVAHAFLFCGMRGVGKTSTARLLAKALNCEKGPTPEPCNACVPCREITAGVSVDVLEIDGASNRGIHEVRQIIENVRYRPAACRFKIYIIDEVHQVTTDAFNALLKTLEEPPEHVKFIFATTEPHKVPRTIVSRCQRYDFKRIGARAIVEHLSRICRREGIEVDEASLLALAREADGSMRDAQSLLDQVVAFAGSRIGLGDVRRALGIADRSLLYATADALVRRSPKEALEKLDELHTHGYDLHRFARELLEHFRNVAVARVGADEILSSDLSEEEHALVRRHAEALSSEDVERAFRILLDAGQELSRAPYPKLVLEMALVKLATLPPVVPIEEVLERIERLVSSGASPSAPEAGAPSRPEVRARSEAPGNAAKRTSAPAPASPAGGSWSAFLEFVKKRKPPLFALLSQCSTPREKEGELEVEVPAGFHHDYLSRKENLEVLRALGSEFYGRPVELRLRAAGEAAQKPKAEDLRRSVLENPAVRAAVDILGGQVQEVKARPGKERGK